MFPNSQKGFSLPELAIVLVIIGLLLGGILQGQSLIRGMYVKDAMGIAKDLSASTRYFLERYNYLPGDMPLASNDILQATVACNGNGDGSISAAESACVPQHLSLAGYIKGGTGGITSHFGAVRVIALSASNVVWSPPTATIINVIEFANLPCDVAMELDLKMDDGNIGTGNAQGSSATCTVGGANDPLPFFGIAL